MATEANNRDDQLDGTNRAKRMISVARLVLIWERLWPAMWPGVGVIGLFGVLALTGVLAALPSLLHVFLLFGLIGAATFFFWRDLSTFVPPSWEDSARRVERDSGLAHRPLTEVADSLVAGRGDGLSEHLWRLHILWLLSAARRLRLSWPTARVSDPYALRFVILAGLVIGALMAGRDAGRRLSDGLSPDLSGGADHAVLNAWLTPPAYTGLPPQTLSVAQRGVIHAPKGSMLVLRLRDSIAQPGLRVVPSIDNVHPDFARVGSDYEAKTILAKDARVSVRLGMHTYADWRIILTADLPPTVAFSEPPSATQQQALKFAYRASDDYAVVKLEAQIRPAVANAAASAALIVSLPIPPKGQQSPQTAYRDLTPEPYAGLKVTITLVATDGSGQSTQSAPVTATLPERAFTKPLAQALVEQRRTLALNGLPVAPLVRDVVDALTVAPDRFYKDEFGTYLALRALYAQLADVRAVEDLKPTMDFMWDIALGIEEGDLSLAANDLRNSQKALMDALERGASDEEIAGLMQKMRQALSRYLQSLAQSAPQSGQPRSQNTRSITQQDLADLMAAIQDLSRTGARDQARQLLAQLSDILENMRTARSGGQSPQQQATTKALENLSDLMARQRDLMDRTFRAQQGQPSAGQGQMNRGNAQQSQSQTGGMSKEQRELKDQLDSIMGGLVQNAISAPRGLGSAGEAMGKSADNLDNGSYDQAAKSQQDALQSMRDGAQALAQSQLSGNGTGGTSDSDIDPLGRNAGSTGFGGSVKIPQESQLARAREILNELRRRAAERGRPQQELDYLERLLKRF